MTNNKTFRELLSEQPKEKLLDFVTGKNMEAASCCPHDFGFEGHRDYEHCLGIGNCTACWDRQSDVKKEPKAEAKPCPVDRGKLLIGLECCRIDVAECEECPYNHEKCSQSTDDALAYIGFLEERLAQLEQDGGE